MNDLPLFPLNIFLLPGDFTQLYIFEERYKQLIGECVDNETLFGIPFSSRANTLKLGSLVKVSEVTKRYPGGEMDIIVQSVGVFRLAKFNMQKEGKLYPSGNVIDMPEMQNYPAKASLIKHFKNYVEQRDDFENQMLKVNNLGVFDVANELYLSDADKLELLNCTHAEELNDFLNNYLHYLNLLEQQEKSVYQNIYLN